MSLSASERIKSPLDFEKIYSTGNILFSKDKKLKAGFCISDNSNNPHIKIAAAVFSKAGNAVWRNRIKRLIKEAYRKNKEMLASTCNTNNKSVLLVFSPNRLNMKENRKIYLHQIEPAILDILLKIKNIITDV